MFEEGDSVTAVVLGDESEFDTDEYTVNVNYGNETVSYKLKDLIEMAEKSKKTRKGPFLVLENFLHAL